MRMLAAAVVVLAIGSCTSASEPTPAASPTVFSSVTPAPHARISALYLLPYPEGPPGYFCPHPEARIGISTCLRLVMSDVTGALGNPVVWPAPTPSQDCQTSNGWSMKVLFVDRTRLVYGPCEQPPSIVALRDAILQEPAPT